MKNNKPQVKKVVDIIYLVFGDMQDAKKLANTAPKEFKDLVNERHFIHIDSPKAEANLARLQRDSAFPITIGICGSGMADEFVAFLTCESMGIPFWGPETTVDWKNVTKEIKKYYLEEIHGKAN
jgi:hypothetical protein